MEASDPSTAKKSIFKKWWFWVGLVVVLIIIGKSTSNNGDNTKATSNVSKDTAKANTVSTTTTQSSSDSLNQRLKKEISSFNKPFDGSTYRGSADNLQIELALFNVWADMVHDGESDVNKENQTLAAKLKKKVAALQVKEFPAIRKAYGKLASNILWKNDVEVSTGGSGYSTITFTGGIFAAHQDIQDFQEEVAKNLSMYRFRTSRYQWIRESDDPTEYDLDSYKDDDVIDIVKNKLCCKFHTRKISCKNYTLY